ncbi:MAG: hypothetical protein LBI05_08995, partial [Planctomycetaceae bacterium]|nr:hypothetical protein [Planctomycetaceae bacterium]
KKRDFSFSPSLRRFLLTRLPLFPNIPTPYSYAMPTYRHNAPSPWKATDIRSYPFRKKSVADSIGIPPANFSCTASSSAV